MGYGLIGILYPSLCRSCGCFISRHAVFCDVCYTTIEPIDSVCIPLNLNYLLKIFAISAYVDPIKSLVLQKFYGDVRASIQLGRLAYELLALSGFDYVVPVPLHWSRYARRGFNQAAYMGKTLSSGLGLPVLGCVKRGRRTSYQSRLSVGARQENVVDAFAIRKRYREIFPAIVRDKSILLVDDLYTTGSTLKSIANLFVPCRPKRICAIVACRV